MKFFFQTTKNNIVIMGKNTYFSLPENIRPLKNRLNIVLTRKPNEYMNEYKNIPELVFTDFDNIHLYIQENKELPLTNELCTKPRPYIPGTPLR